jgi:hypothetical protein
MRVRKGSDGWFSTVTGGGRDCLKGRNMSVVNGQRGTSGSKDAIMTTAILGVLLGRRSIPIYNQHLSEYVPFDYPRYVPSAYITR